MKSQSQYIAKSKIEKKLHSKILKFGKIFRIIPFVRLVAVCNNVSFFRVKENSDIDIFIVAKKGRLFIVRTLVTFLLHVFGVRRYGKKINARFCLSFFVDESVVDFSSIAVENDIYLAYWINRLKLIVDYSNFYEKTFLPSNSWILKFWDNSFLADENRFYFFINDNIFYKSFRFLISFFLLSYWGNFIESLLRKWQLKRAGVKLNKLGKNSSIVLSANMLKFHNFDRRLLYRKQWFKLFSNSEKINDDKFLALDIL